MNANRERPGLQNVIERAVIATRGGALTLPHGIESQPLGRSLSPRTLAEVERDHILETLRTTKEVVGCGAGAPERPCGPPGP